MSKNEPSDEDKLAKTQAIVILGGLFISILLIIWALVTGNYIGA